MKQIGIRWPERLIARIDSQRGSRSRSDFIRDAVEAVLSHDEKICTPDISVQTTTPLSTHVHRKDRVASGGVWVCSCEQVSTDNGRSWR